MVLKSFDVKYIKTDAIVAEYLESEEGKNSKVSDELIVTLLIRTIDASSELHFLIDGFPNSMA